MKFTTIISPQDLNKHLTTFRVLDLRFSLSNPSYGISAYREGHIPGAVFIDFEEHLCSPVIPGITGRHPLPDPHSFAHALGSWGIDNNTQVVCYDDAGGAIAARLWWMLRWLGHDSVAVLDGGWQAWEEEKLPVETNVKSPTEKVFHPTINPVLVTDVDQVLAAEHSSMIIVDSRATERYRGLIETIDPVAGRIPWAVSFPHTNTVTSDGRFRSPEEIKGSYTALLGQTDPSNVAFYCGSGVTACRNILAMEHAGLGMPTLYPGSFSEWIADPTRPIFSEKKD